MRKTHTLIGLALVTSALTARGADTQTPTGVIEQKIFEITGKDSATLGFQRHSNAIDSGDETKLKAVVNAMRDTGPVKEILVLAYADLGYPRNQKSDLPSASIKLADERGDAVKNELEQIGAEHITVYNMAKKASWFERTFVTSDAQVKREAVEKPAKTDADDAFYQALGQRLRTEGGAGKVVVVVRHEGMYSH